MAGDVRLGPYAYEKIDAIRYGDTSPDVDFLLGVIDDMTAVIEYAHADDIRALTDFTNYHWVLDIRDWLSDLETLRTKYDLQENKI